MRKSMNILTAAIVFVAGAVAAPMIHAQEPDVTQDSTKGSEKMGSGMMGHGGMMDREKMKNMMEKMEQMKQMMATCQTMMQTQMDEAETETPSE